MSKNLIQKGKRRHKRKQIKNHDINKYYNWYAIEILNEGLGITRYTCFVDNNGYLRWKSNRKLCHREIAYNYIYKMGSFELKFSDYDVHHKDEYKFNNQPNNLELKLREEHELKHGNIIFENGKKYVKLCPTDIRRKETLKAIYIRGKGRGWFPKSQLITRNDNIYCTEWIFNKKNNRS